jgi:hypothetical protein
MRGQVKPGARTAGKRNEALGNKHFKETRRQQVKDGTLDYERHHCLYRGEKVTAKFPRQPQ